MNEILETLALTAGNIGIFILLTFVMILTIIEIVFMPYEDEDDYDYDAFD